MQLANRVAGLSTTIFTEINELAVQHGALNLGQGRPDFDAPAAIVDALTAAARNPVINQYAPGNGMMALRQAVASHTSAFYGIEPDPAQGVLITAGATQAVFNCILGTVDRGDEVIVIEPYFDSYLPNLTFVGATPVFVPLHPPDWTFDPDELRRAFTPRTKAILLNTPQNPTGRVFTRGELVQIADLCIEHDIVVISDEVYEHLIFDHARHVPIASLPGMFERTLTVSSLGKTFSVTGWKIGWVYGHPDLMQGPIRANQYVTFAANHPAQAAAAYALAMPFSYYEEFQAMYTTKRDLLMQALSSAGIRARSPQGTYFIMGDFSDVFDGDDIEFARFLTAEIGVACIPPTFFYSTEHAHMAATQARFAFCKSDEMLQEVGERLSRLNR
jgi:N-succinyldiaminopimelate aminotransferase